jgi:hypothetical protein
MLASKALQPWLLLGNRLLWEARSRAPCTNHFIAMPRQMAPYSTFTVMILHTASGHVASCSRQLVSVRGGAFDMHLIYVGATARPHVAWSLAACIGVWPRMQPQLSWDAAPTCVGAERKNRRRTLPGFTAVFNSWAVLTSFLACTRHVPV